MISMAVLQHGHLLNAVGVVLDLEVIFFLFGAFVCHVDHELDIP